MIVRVFSLFFLFVNLWNFVLFYAEDYAEDPIDQINESMQEEYENFEVTGEITELKKQLEDNKAEIIALNDQAKEVQNEIDELNAKIPQYEEQAGNVLMLGQKTSNSSLVINFLTSVFTADNLKNYVVSKKTLEKLKDSVKEESMKLFQSIEDLEEKKVELKDDIDHLKKLEKQLVEQIDVIKDTEKKTIISEAYNTSVNFYNQYCYEGQVYGVDCGDSLEESDEFIRPIKEGYVTNEFGGWDALDQDDGHTGIDMADDAGMDGYREIYPAAPGQVVDVFVDSYGGIQVMMIHVIDGKNYITNYAHLESVNVLPGEIIGVNDVIGTMGETGVATGVHLHFEVIEGPYYIHSELENPRYYVTFPAPYATFKEEEREEE